MRDRRPQNPMKITTLGTSHGDHTYCRFNSSTLFEIGDASYLVDAGEPVNGLMIRAGKSFGPLRAVFITHMHEDHVGGVPDLIKALIKYPSDTRHTRIFLPEAAAIPGLEAWLHAMHLKWPSPMVSLDAAHEGNVYEDEVLKVSAVRTHQMPHPDWASFAYVLEAEGKRVICTGDLRADFSDFPAIARKEPCDLCLCEITHYQPEVALPVLTTCPIKRMVFNHVHNPWHGDEGEAALREKFADLPFPWDVAHDGDEFDV